ncbi:MAG: hypothetical protein U0166_19600 [Acidobacteriota bacterium]
MKGESMLKLITKTSGRATVAVLFAALLVGVGGCANTNTRDEDSRGASLLIVEKLAAQDVTGADVDFLFSDVLKCDADGTNCTIVEDNGKATLRNMSLNQDPNTQTSSAYQDIQMYRLSVQYTRGDGHNVQGVDIPYNFDAVMSGTVVVNTTQDFFFVLVRHVAKMERPLVDLIGSGSEEIIYTNTRCDFYGRDIAGNEHQCFAWIDIEFGDFQLD